MADTMTSQNIDLLSWDTLYITYYEPVFIQKYFHFLLKLCYF
jgi:hypothetical protein